MTARGGGPPIIEVCGLEFAYPGNHRVLCGVSFSIGPHESVALVGPNGAGKSTLLQHLNGSLTAAAGEVRVDGVAITAATVAVARSRVGMVFQDPDDQLFMPTVVDDVAFGPINLGCPELEIESRVADALDRVGMTHLRERPPYRLSAGEKRAVAIAGVMAMQPGVLVMDEPTANLDPRGRRRLLAFLQGCQPARLIATHDLEFVVELCSRVIVLDEGRIVADGPTGTLLGDEALMLAHGLECPHSLRHRHPHA